MTRSLARFAPLAVLLGLSVTGAFAGNDPAEPKKKPDADAPKAPEWKGPDIDWVHSYAEARDESMERNVAIYIHSHGST